MGVISSNVYSRLLLIPPDNLRHLWGNLGNSYQTRLKWKSQFFLLFKNIFAHIWLYLGCFAKHEQTHLKWECEILPSLDVFLHAKKLSPEKMNFARHGVCTENYYTRKAIWLILSKMKQNETEWKQNIIDLILGLFWVLSPRNWEDKNISKKSVSITF